MSKYKLDIFKLLSDIRDPNAGDIYAGLDDVQKKGFGPSVVMRWMSGTSDQRQIMLLNEFVNPYAFALGKHPHLLMLCMQAVATKTPGRYQWVGIKSSTKNSEARRVMMEYFGISSREAKFYPIPPVEELVEMGLELGWQKDEISKLQKEQKK